MEYLQSLGSYAWAIAIVTENSEEFRGSIGLSIIEGSTIKFANHDSINTIPHVGWNSVRINQDANKSDAMRGIKDGDFFYFVHSLYVKPNNRSFVKKAQICVWSKRPIRTSIPSCGCHGLRSIPVLLMISSSVVIPNCPQG